MANLKRRHLLHSALLSFRKFWELWLCFSHPLIAVSSQGCKTNWSTSSNLYESLSSLKFCITWNLELELYYVPDGESQRQNTNIYNISCSESNSKLDSCRWLLSRPALHPHAFFDLLPETSASLHLLPITSQSILVNLHSLNHRLQHLQFSDSQPPLLCGTSSVLLISCIKTLGFWTSFRACQRWLQFTKNK